MKLLNRLGVLAAICFGLLLVHALFLGGDEFDEFEQEVEGAWMRAVTNKIYQSTSRRVGHVFQNVILQELHDQIDCLRRRVPSAPYVRANATSGFHPCSC